MFGQRSNDPAAPKRIAPAAAASAKTQPAEMKVEKKPAVSAGSAFAPLLAKLKFKR